MQMILQVLERLFLSCHQIVGILTAEFSVGERTVEDRAKLAEALTRASRRLGPLLPHYKEQFINALLAGV